LTARKVRELQGALTHVANSLRSQYVIGYAPAAGDKADAKVEVKVLERKGAPKLRAVVSSPAASAK
jgi:hypothetical protein